MGPVAVPSQMIRIAVSNVSSLVAGGGFSLLSSLPVLIGQPLRIPFLPSLQLQLCLMGLPVSYMSASNSHNPAAREVFSYLFYLCMFY